MIDLVCLVADKNLEAAIDGILRRPKAIGIREVQGELVVHPQRDPGCFHKPADLLSGYRGRARHALIVLDRAWEGAPAATGIEMEELLERSLVGTPLAGWARALVIDPELEVWVFSDSPHVGRTLGWPDENTTLRAALAAHDLWPEEHAKPPDPKAAVEWTLRKARKPRSSSIYRELADRVSFTGCQDRSFLRLKSLVTDWFGGTSRE